MKKKDPPVLKRDTIKRLYESMPSGLRERVDRAVKSMARVKKKGGRIAVVTGSGPNVHEGVTTLIAGMIQKGIVDGVTTSSAVVAHEMAGTLEKVKRVDGGSLGIQAGLLPRGDLFEITLMDDDLSREISGEMIVDKDLIRRAAEMPGSVIIKAAGNMGYPLGLRTEKLAQDILFMAQSLGIPFEKAAGAGADPITMLGAGFARNVPVLVTVPQLIGGGRVGLAVGDSISIAERAAKVARMMEEADVIIESAVVLTQEIHDGPFETHTGHGIWAKWEGLRTYSLKDKVLIRIDLDPQLNLAWSMEKESAAVQKAIDAGLPKTKLMSIPFRMEMSGFARLDKSIPIVGDIGVIWPVMAVLLEKELGITLDFLSYPQQTDEGKDMREWIVRNIRPVDRKRLYERLAGES